MNGTREGFCRDLLDDALELGLDPEGVADRFLRYFNVSGRPTVPELTVLLEEADFGTVTGRCLEAMKGIHYSAPGGGYDIHYREDLWDGAKEHTLLHETFEIINETMCDLYSDSVPVLRVCRQADRFAAAALMPPDMFSLCAQASGFDVVALQAIYQRAYASITMRLAEVMRHQPLMTILYERREVGNPRQWFDALTPGGLTAKVVARTSGFRLRTTRRPLSCLRRLLPRRGASPTPGSVAERVALTGRPVYVERVSGYDLWQNDDVTVVARPVIWHGRVAKIAVVAVPHRDRSVLAPQLDQAYFERIPHAHQVL
ncbi:MAG: hypothetical protein OYI31_02450 [Chloroflexota bacterium]|nr:hypothetical protein [Chloroflexota bacterium]MDE2941663.1 hypothetical protein [Chloroflexota bacterium]MDE3267306.1 hypothetical protein [Chloroflexota bacterium]